LEALACGVPVVGAKLDDPWEVNDPDSSLIVQADPHSKQDIINAVLAALTKPKGEIPLTLKKYYCAGFNKEVEAMLRKLIRQND
jgi:glycosyltransferase involved in cell wall biosynthesis